MSGRIEARLKELGIALPPAAAPAGSYVPYVATGNLIYVSGQLPFEDGQIRHKGILGSDVSVADGAAAARLCALNLIAQVKSAVGDLDRVARVVKLNGFVASAANFTEQPKVMNGASDLMVEVFGDPGRHARAAVGVAALPLGVAVEVDGVFEIF
ncbi:MAG TPA: RidA family protein [Alphaproteobacteria bacterium]|jgi:enamine deaminase RidA (YjgF/YER057c/UK114 family)|nr:RidA family protein [Alphaproteobacteria bacterium]